MKQHFLFFVAATALYVGCPSTGFAQAGNGNFEPQHLDERSLSQWAQAAPVAPPLASAQGAIARSEELAWQRGQETAEATTAGRRRNAQNPGTARTPRALPPRPARSASAGKR